MERIIQTDLVSVESVYFYAFIFTHWFLDDSVTLQPQGGTALSISTERRFHF